MKIKKKPLTALQQVVRSVSRNANQKYTRWILISDDGQNIYWKAGKSRVSIAAFVSMAEIDGTAKS